MYTKMRKQEEGELYNLTLKSAEAKDGEVFIFEKGDMNDLFSKEESEKIRFDFLAAKTKVKQITNKSSLPKFSENDDFINKVITFRYVQKEIFNIENELLIFDDIVAVYNKEEILIVKDKVFAENQKQMFAGIWEQGQSPELGFDYLPNHSFYNNLNYYKDEMQIIVWPDADAKETWSFFSKKSLGGIYRKYYR